MTYINLTKKIEDIPKVKTILINDVALDPENWDLNLKLKFCGFIYIKSQIDYIINYLNLYIYKKCLISINYVFNIFISKNDIKKEIMRNYARNDIKNEIIWNNDIKKDNPRNNSTNDIRN